MSTSPEIDQAAAAGDEWRRIQALEGNSMVWRETDDLGDDDDGRAHLARTILSAPGNALGSIHPDTGPEVVDSYTETVGGPYDYS